MLAEKTRESESGSPRDAAKSLGGFSLVSIEIFVLHWWMSRLARMGKVPVFINKALRGQNCSLI